MIKKVLLITLTVWVSLTVVLSLTSCVQLKRCDRLIEQRNNEEGKERAATDSLIVKLCSCDEHPNTEN